MNNKIINDKSTSNRQKRNNIKKMTKLKNNEINLNDKDNPYSIFWANEILKKNEFCIGINYNIKLAKPNLKIFIKPIKPLSKSKSIQKIKFNNKIYNLYL